MEGGIHLRITLSDYKVRLLAAKTKVGYQTNQFFSVLTRACQRAKEIIQAKKTPDPNGALSTEQFIENTGVDDILSNETEISNEAPSTCHSSEKLTMFKKIFADHFDELAPLNLRPSIPENIERMLACGDPSKGGTLYACPVCQQHLRFSPFHCGSRFCPSCGNLYNMRRANAMLCKVIDAPHRHVTLTIPEELRDFFRLHREALDDLFSAVADTIYYAARKVSPAENYEPGFITVLHTFGRDLKWNPHCHVLLCSMIFGNTKSATFFLPYPLLRKSFQRCLLDRLKKRYGPVFSELSSLIYKAHPNGFYVHAPEIHGSTQAVIKYIGRYLGRPPIASSRIDAYDGTSVTFHYTRHEDNQTVSETIPVMDFIKKLILHIPEKHFKMVRYYGFYSSEGAHKPQVARHNLHPKVSPEHRRELINKLTWRLAIMQVFLTDPLECPCCGAKMKPVFFTYNGRTHFFRCWDKERALAFRYRFLMRTSQISSA